MKTRAVLSAALLTLLFHPSAKAQVPDTPIGQSIVGTWVSEIADPSGNLHPFEFGTFSPDGSYIGANVNGLQSTHMGVWQRTGHLNFALTVEFSRQDAQGAFIGFVRVRAAITLADDLKSYDSTAERTVMDTSGNILSITGGIRGHAVRMEVLPPPQ